MNQPARNSTVGRRASAFIFLFALGTAAYAQSGPSAQLVYSDDDSALRATAASGASRALLLGDYLRAGETLATGASTAEIKLIPNGSIVKIARNSIFKVEGLAGASGSDTNEFALLGGKLRTVAARSSGSEKYRIRTPSAVAGVRGTDFSLSVVDGLKDAIYVKKGLVEFGRTLADGSLQSIMVGPGQFADAFAPAFAPLAATAAQLAEEFGDLEFQALDPDGVGQAAQEAPPEEKATEAAEASGATPAVAAAGPAQTEERERAGGESKFLSALGQILGFEIGSVVIDGSTYSKAVVQPTFSIGKLKMSLYLPVIYTSDLFDPETWYRPEGNNEWSFGAEHWADDPLEGAQDFLRDTALKIRYIEYGTPMVDPFYLKVGNLSTMTLGHGILMRNFANDSDFPAVRRVGFNSGFDAGSWGLEAVINDLGEPEILGGRVKLFHIFGVSAIADIDPAGDLASKEERDALGDPILIGGALDLDIPLLKNPAFNLRAYADLAAVAPYTRVDIPGGPDAGFQSAAIYNDDADFGLDTLRNYGFITGLMGRFIILDWRLEYRYYRGAFRPTLFDGIYERNRVQYAVRFMDLVTNKDQDAAAIQGIYGEAGFALLNEKLVLTAGYLMPWSSEDLSWSELSREDYFLARLSVKKGLIPLYGLSGSVGFERTGFAYALSKGRSVFDADTVFKGELVFPIAKTVDFAVMASNAAVRSEKTTLADPEYKTSPTITFETRIHF